MIAVWRIWRTPFYVLPDLTDAQKQACEQAARDAWRQSNNLPHADRLAASRLAFGRERARLQNTEVCSPLPVFSSGVGGDECGPGWPVDNAPVECWGCDS